MLSFPSGFVWGAATSSHQTEGGNSNNDWWTFENAAVPLAAEASGDACDSYHRYEQDLTLLADSGLQSYRFSLEWSRIEPAPGRFSRAALDHYQRMIDACLERGIAPVITLHHFTNPAWLRQLGSWNAPAVVDHFARYAETAIGSLTGISRLCTINEPNMIATYAGLFSGAELPPGGPAPDPRVTEHLIAAHRQAMDLARSAGMPAGLTVAMTAYTSDGSPAADEAIASLRGPDEDVFINACLEDDFLGVQAYTRRFADASGVLPHGHDPNDPNAEQTLTGWNVYPRSIGDCLRRAHELAPDLPLLVTENGIATSDDEARIAYTAEALRSVHEVIADGIRVDGYWHWSLLDNFEWTHGYGPTFGLIAVDRETFLRTPKPSLDWLGRVAKGNAVVA